MRTAMMAVAAGLLCAGLAAPAAAQQSHPVPAPLEAAGCAHASAKPLGGVDHDGQGAEDAERLEDLRAALQLLVRAGSLSPVDAERALAADWRTAYLHYVVMYE